MNSRTKALLATMVSAISVAVAVRACSYTAEQTRIAQEKLLLEKEAAKEKLVREAAKLSIRFVLFDNLMARAFLRPLLPEETGSRRADIFGTSPPPPEYADGLRDLGMKGRPRLVVPPAIKRSLQEFWDSKAWPDMWDATGSILDQLKQAPLWKGVLARNRVSVENEPVEGFGSETPHFAAVPRLSIKGKHLIGVEPGSSGCGETIPGTIYYPHQLLLAAVIGNTGQRDAQTIRVRMSVSTQPRFKLVPIASAFGAGGNSIEQQVNDLRPGEQLLIAMAFVLRNFRDDTFAVAPVVSVERLDYDDPIVGSLGETARPFSQNSLLPVSTHFEEGSCPFLVFLDGAGKILSERRVLVAASSPGLERRDRLIRPEHATEVRIEEREPETTFIRHIKLFSQMGDVTEVTLSDGVTVLTKGESLKFHLAKETSALEVAGYYVPTAE